MYILTVPYSLRSASRVYFSTSYYVQKVDYSHSRRHPRSDTLGQLFSLNKGTEYLPSTLPSPNGTIFWSVTRDNSRNVFIKVGKQSNLKFQWAIANLIFTISLQVINTGPTASAVEFKLPFRVFSQGTVQVLSGSNSTSNTPSTPNAAVPKTSGFRAAKTFTYNAPGFSLSVLTLKTE